MKLECVNISSNDPAKLAEFYRKLGVGVFVRGKNYDGFNFGNAENEATVCVWDKNRWGGQKGEFVTLVFKVYDLNETYNSLVAKGLNIDPPSITDWGGQKLLLEDPDGNEVMIL